MENVLLVLTLISCLALIVAVLLQRSEGGALGMGGGGGGGLMSGRGAANSLVRGTMILAAIFFVSCLALTRIANDKARDASDVIRTIEEQQVDPFGETFGDETAVSSTPAAASDVSDTSNADDLFSTTDAETAPVSPDASNSESVSHEGE